VTHLTLTFGSRELTGSVMDTISDEELAELVRRTEEATTAFMRGDMHRYLELTPHAGGFTLMNPFGGPPKRYRDRSESILAAAAYFRGGEATLEVAEAHAWGDTVVLAMIERQHGEVGGLPDQDWPLRVTQIYRREGSDWLLVHRHADPLVDAIGLERASALAAGS
jgi:ketosteroid isomerase-like protein